MRYEVRDQRGAVGEKLLVCGERKSDAGQKDALTEQGYQEGRWMDQKGTQVLDRTKRGDGGCSSRLESPSPAQAAERAANQGISCV
jgi:hypothetical protein